MLVNRKIRDASFRRQVCDAYEQTCAVTGLRIVNGSGKAEVQAAHIWPVADGGPDVVQNGIALSGTVHWLFDRHLISMTDDYGLLVSHNRVPRELQYLFQRHLDRVHLPKQQSLWPHLSLHSPAMSDREYWTRRLRDAERELDAATRRSDVNDAARRFMRAKAELRAIEKARPTRRPVSGAAAPAASS